MNTVLAKDIKKGTKIVIRQADGGSEIGETVDNISNRSIRNVKMMSLFGTMSQGSIMTATIVEAEIDGVWRKVEHTEKAKRANAMSKALLG